LYDEILRIPFLLIPPRGSALATRVPARIEQQVRLVDVRPTVLALAGLPEAPDMQGSDLTPCLRGVTRSCRSLPAPLYAAALRQGGLKLVRVGRRMSLFDLQEDPGEQTNLAQEEGSAERVRAMSRYLDDLRSRHENLRKKILAGAAETPPPQLGREAEERLRALGYTE
jgi:arylsulfatase A-like enzyme